jgi:ankyrin repeat protein
MAISFQSDEEVLRKLRDKRKMSDEELIKFGKDVRKLAENPFQRQLEEARKEWKRRKALVSTMRNPSLMNEDELKLRMDLPRYEALPPREKYLLNLDDADREGTPRLVLASTFGDLEMVKSLISEGADLNATSSAVGGLKLIAARQSPSAEQLRDLQTIMSLIPEEIMKSQMARAADPSATRSSGETALMVASRFGFAEIVEALLYAGAQIDKQDARGVPALYIAAENGHAGIVMLLLARGADPLFKTTDATKFLSAAVVGGNTEIINLALQYPCQISAGSKYGSKLLLLAARKRRADIAEKLIELGADVNVADQGGTTPLIAAAPCDDNPGPVGTKLISLLLRHGANVDAANNNGSTALMGASLYGDLEVVKLLVGAGANVSNTDAMGRTAISLALESNHHDIVDFLKSQN